MKTVSEKQKFIELRAKGLSFEKISQEMQVSKPTLIKWHQEYRQEIANLKYFEIESLIHQHGLAKKARIESLVIVLRKAMNQLNARTLEDVSTKDLILMIFQLDAKIKNELSSCQYFTGEFLNDLNNYPIDSVKEKTLPFIY